MAREERAMRADVETRAGPDDHQSLRLWLRLLACTNLIETQVRQGLKAGYSTTLPRFDLMAQLDRAEEGLKMGELATHDGDRRQRHRDHRHAGKGTAQSVSPTRRIVARLASG